MGPTVAPVPNNLIAVDGDGAHEPVDEALMCYARRRDPGLVLYRYVHGPLLVVVVEVGKVRCM